MSDVKVPAMRKAANLLLWMGAVIGLLSMALAATTVVTGLQPLIVRSASMEPALGTGSLAIAKSVDAAKVTRGDIVSAIDRDGRRVTHRVTAVDTSGDKTALTLKGDSNKAPDAQPYLVDDVDRVLFDIPLLGYVASWAGGRGGMFLAGLLIAAIVTTLVRRPGQRRAHAAGASVVLAALGLVATTMTVPISTDAYFTDNPKFEAGTIMAHQVQAFDWAATPCVQSGPLNANITLNYRVKDARYSVVWDRYPQSGGSPTRIKSVLPTGGPGTAVATSFAGADLSPGLAIAGTYRLVGSSKLKGTATQEWLSQTKREALFTITGLGALSTVQCGSVNVGPTIVFKKPVAGDVFANESAAETALNSNCGALAPCGTAADDNGIKSVEYRLQRVNGLGTYCWNPAAIFGGWGLLGTGCNTWRAADTSPPLPTSGPATVNWSIPLGGNDSTISQSGAYTLFMRVTDNAGNTATTESTITFRRN